jgi:hypothetical protein
MKSTRHAATRAVTAGTFLWSALALAWGGPVAYAQDNVGAAPPPPGGPQVVQDQPADPPAPIPSTAPMTAAPFVAPASGGTGGGGAGRRSGTAAATSNGPLTGYSYGDHDSPEVQAVLAGHQRYTTPGAPTGHVRHASAKSGNWAVATYPGFTMRDDGGSRVFVQLTRPVTVEEHRAAGEITYLLKGAHVTERNNENALVTVHFNTPVSRARLRPVGGGLALTIELRGAAQPTYKVEGADGGSRLVIDFPEGHFLDESGEPMRAARGQALAGDGTYGNDLQRPVRSRSARRGAHRGVAAPHPPDTSGMSDTTDTNP